MIHHKRASLSCTFCSTLQATVGVYTNWKKRRTFLMGCALIQKANSGLHATMVGE